MKKKEFNELLSKLDNDHYLQSTDKLFIIWKIKSRDIMNVVGGGYGEYIGEPKTLSGYLIIESNWMNPKWYIETNIGKKIRKNNWEIIKKE